MTEEAKKSWYWTGGITLALVAVVVALWFAGVFEAPSAVQ